MKDHSPTKDSSLFSDNSSNNDKIKKSPSPSSNNIFYRFSKSRSRSRSNENTNTIKTTVEDKAFTIKNGCCRECMRAFSKTGKSCLCQVPKKERKYALQDKGCNFCGCNGCNPIDVKKEKRKEIKYQLQNDKNIMYKKQRIIDSDDEELQIHLREPDEYNKLKKNFEVFLENYLKYPNFSGYGMPKRTSSYLLGYNPSQNNDKKKKNNYSQEKYNSNANKDSPKRRNYI